MLVPNTVMRVEREVSERYQLKGLRAAIQKKAWSQGANRSPCVRWSRAEVGEKTKRSSFRSQHPGPYLPQHHDDAVGAEEAGGVSLIQAQSRLHGQPGPSPEILFH